MRTLTIASAIAVATMAMPGAALAQEGPYRFSTTIPVGGGDGWDYLSVDSAAHRLYVSHATKVVVIDTATHTICLSAADYEPQAPGSKERPKMVPGSFKVLVYRMRTSGDSK